MYMSSFNFIVVTPWLHGYFPAMPYNTYETNVDLFLRLIDRAISVYVLSVCSISSPHLRITFLNNVISWECRDKNAIVYVKVHFKRLLY